MPRPKWEAEFHQQQLDFGYNRQQADLLLKAERLRRNGGDVQRQWRLLQQVHLVASGVMSVRELRQQHRSEQALDSEDAGYRIFPTFFGNKIITLTKTEGNLFHTQPFQRLGQIRQLGDVPSWYTTASHTRRAHTLDVLKLTDDVGKRLDIPHHELRHLRLAALLHDAGHSAFSHYGDRFLAEQLGTTHEELSIAVLDHPVVRKILSRGRVDIELLKSYLRGEGLGELISGELGTDRMAYLATDSHTVLGRKPVTIRPSDAHKIRKLPEEQVMAVGVGGPLYMGPGRSLFELYAAQYHTGGYPRMMQIIDELPDHLVAHGGRILLRESGIPLASEFLRFRAFMRKHVYVQDETAMARVVIEHAMAHGLTRGLITPASFVDSTDESLRAKLSEDPEIAPFAKPAVLEHFGNFRVFRASSLRSRPRSRFGNGTLAARLSSELAEHFAPHEFVVSQIPAERNYGVVPVLGSGRRVVERRVDFDASFAPEAKIVVAWHPRVRDEAARLVDAHMAPHLKATARVAGVER